MQRMGGCRVTREKDEARGVSGWMTIRLIVGLVLAWAMAMTVPGWAHEEHGGGHASHGSVRAEPGQWEGSPEGVAFSEFNHHLSGLAVILVGLSELRTALGFTILAWSRFLLPVGMLGFGAYLLVWSDHLAWPIGPMSFAQTFSGGHMEILQHKVYSLLLLGIGFVELLRRVGRLDHWAWGAPLPGFAIIGGLMLFMHMHGPHPSAHTIAIHHSVMGVMAIAGGLCKFVSEYGKTGAHLPVAPAHLAVAWAGLTLLIGGQLLIYSE